MIKGKEKKLSEKLLGIQNFKQINKRKEGKTVLEHDLIKCRLIL